jgi:predicted Fe-S protein YdhL (DUF1289 family)
MPAVATPCVKVCTLDSAAGICLGCGRTLGEIERWLRITDDERARIMAELPARLASRRIKAASA